MLQIEKRQLWIFFLFYVASNVYLLCFFLKEKKKIKTVFVLQLRLCAVVVVLSFFRLLFLSCFSHFFFIFKDICFSVECSIYITITRYTYKREDAVTICCIYRLIVYINEIFEYQEMSLGTSKIKEIFSIDQYLIECQWHEILLRKIIKMH